MSHAGSPFARLLKRLVPRSTGGPREPRELAAGLWALDSELLHFGFARLPTRSLLVRLADGGLVVVSPPPRLAPEEREAIDRLGPVAQLLIPNSFHYVFADELASQFADAELLAPPAFSGRVPELANAKELSDDSPGRWAGALEHVVLGPVEGLAELLLFHEPSATLILTDLAFHMRAYPRAADRAFWRLSGFPAGFAPGRTARTLLLRDRDVATRALTRALDWPFRRIVVSHGDIIERDARSAYLRAFEAYLDGGA